MGGGGALGLPKVFKSRKIQEGELTQEKRKRRVTPAPRAHEGQVLFWDPPSIHHQ